MVLRTLPPKGTMIRANKPTLNSAMALTGSMQIKAGKTDADGSSSLPRFTILAYTGNIIQQGFGDVIVDLKGIKFPQVIPILMHHDAERPVGHSESIQLTEEGLVIEGVLSGDPDSDDVKQIIAMGNNGFPWQASIGASMDDYDFPEANALETVNGREVGENTLIVKASTLFETSILPLGADGDTSTQIAAKAIFDSHFSKEKIEMKFKEWLKANGFGDVTDETILANLKVVYENDLKLQKAIADSADQTSDVFSAQVEAVKAEMAELKVQLRASKIKEICGEHVELAKTAIEDGWTEKQVQAQVDHITKLEAGRATPAGHVKTGIASEEVIGIAAGLALGGKAEDAIKAGVAEKDVEEAQKVSILSFSDIARNLLMAKGINKTSYSKEEMIKASFSYTSIAGILSNSGYKAMIDAYQLAPENVTKVAFKRAFPDFKEQDLYRLNDSMVFEEVPATGEIKHGELSETNFKARIEQYAKQFVLTRKMIINDDLGALTDIMNALGKGASTAWQRNFWKLFIDDGGSFYSVGNKNLIASNALSIDGLTAAFAALESFVDSNGDPINVFDANGQVNLIVPQNLRTYAQQLARDTQVNETTTANKPKPTSNPHNGKLNVVVEPYLNNTALGAPSATTWYLQSGQLTSFVDGRLTGNEVPSLRSEVLPVGQLGVAYDGVFDFGASKQDPKGIIKNTA